MRLEVGTCSSTPGALSTGTLPFGELSDGTPVGVPIVMMTGVHEGPTLWLSAALHGTELIGVEIIRRLLREVLDPGALSGTIVAAPIANPLSFRAARYTTPEDGGNPHHGMPGSASGTLTQRLSHALAVHGLDQADAVIDLHTNPAPYLSFSALSRVPDVSDDAHERSSALASAFGLTIVERTVSREWQRHMAEYVQAQGKPCIAVHFEGYHRFDEDCIVAGVRGCQNALAHLGMIDAAVEPISTVLVLDHPLYRDDRCDLRAERGGLLHTALRPGDPIGAGDLLATIFNPWGETVEEIRSQRDGIYLGLRAEPNQAVHSGQIAVAIGLREPST
jgi:uncharacterized protein